MAVGYVVSDLHLFSKRTTAGRHAETLLEAAGRADVFVLNGDIFDFRWTTLPSVKDTIDEAIRWLERITKRFPDCHFHFILGNHDAHHAFEEKLAHLAKGTSNLNWHPYYLRLGGKVFLHGDVCISSGRPHPTSLERYRARWRKEGRKRGKFNNMLYDAAVQARLHKAIHHLAFPRKRTARSLLTYLEHVGGDAVDGVDSVYFGHTHVAMSGYEYGGIRFHNSGAPMKGVRFKPVKLHL